MSWQYDDGWLAGRTYKVDGTITQVVGVPDPIGISLTMPVGAEMLLLSYFISIGLVAAARAITVQHLEIGTAAVCAIGQVSLNDNEWHAGPEVKTAATTTTGGTVASIGVPYMPYLIAGGEIFRIIGAALANAEVITVRIRVRCRGARPTVEMIGAGIAATGITQAFI